MQEDLENKTVTLIVNGSKFTGRMLKTAISKFLSFTMNQVKKHRSVKPQGKQSVKRLIGQNQGVNNIEFAEDDDIKAFDRVARKYGVDYAVKKVDGEKPRYLLFFKARDADAITSAFTEYTNNWKNQSKDERPSIRKLLADFKQKVADLGKDREKNKEIVR